MLAVEGDATLVVDGGVRVHAFDLASGQLRWERPLPAKMVQAVTVHDGQIVLNSVVGRDLSDRRSLASFPTASATGVVRHGGPLPRPLGQNPVVDQLFSFLQFAFFRADSLAFAIAVNSDVIYLGTFGGHQYDSLPVAKALRRGRVSPGVIAKVMNNPTAVTQEEMFGGSVPWGLAMLADGRIAYLTHDVTFENRRPTGPLYIAIVDRRTRRSCAETRVPVPTDPQPRVAFRGDTLLVLSQDETPDLKPRTTIWKFLIDVEGCQWKT